jgi:hypothetical protein
MAHSRSAVTALVAGEWQFPGSAFDPFTLSDKVFQSEQF